jgi:hypothetical protein
VTEVIRIGDAPRHWRDDPHFVFIGRPSRWGNPFTIGKDGTREEVIAGYRKHLWEQLADPENEELRQAVRDLDERTLVCYCAPKPCHGDILVDACRRLCDPIPGPPPDLDLPEPPDPETVPPPDARLLAVVQADLDATIYWKQGLSAALSHRERVIAELAAQALEDTVCIAGETREEAFDQFKKWRRRCWDPIYAAHQRLTPGPPRASLWQTQGDEEGDTHAGNQGPAPGPAGRETVGGRAQ